MTPVPFLLTLFALLGVGAAGAADFEAALSFPERTANKVFRDRVSPHWLPDGRSFWYRVQTGARSHEFVLVDCETGRRTAKPTLHELELAEPAPLKTSAADVAPRKTTRTGEASTLTFVNRLGELVRLFWIDRDGRRISYGEISPGKERTQPTYDGHVWLVASDAGKHLAVVEAEAQSRTVEIDGAGKAKVAGDDKKRPQVKDSPNEFRSPDGRTAMVLEIEKPPRRKVTIVESSPADGVQPKLKVFEYLKPGDPLPRPRWVLVKGDGTRISVSNEFWSNPFTETGRLRGMWSKDGREFYFDDNERGHQRYRVPAVDAETGEVRIVVEEKSKTFIDYTKKTWRHWLPETDELLWMSERDGWCHLYLYDVPQGKVKKQITAGEWVVREVLHVDAERREAWFLASGLRAEEDPYHLHLCRVNFDGTEFVHLTEGDGHHSVEFSPRRDYFVDTWSRADHPPVVELRRARDGKLVCELERADISELTAAGWTMPERFVAKGRDGETDIHGVLIKPANFDPEKKYPIVEDIYAGPHAAFAPKEFDRLVRMHQHAELGFIVVKLDGMGTNHRGKAFHDVCWKNLRDAGFPDRKKWIAAAARTRPWMDLSRVGIYGGSAGGQNAMRALLDHHEFYDVAVADCGCHDNRMDKIWWNEQWMGWPVDESYERSSNVEDAAKLQGKLLLIVGELDTNVDPASTMQVVAAPQKAGKSFDFMPIAGTGHGAAETPYALRLRMEFLVEHLKP